MTVPQNFVFSGFYPDPALAQVHRRIRVQYIVESGSGSGTTPDKGPVHRGIRIRLQDISGSGSTVHTLLSLSMISHKTVQSKFRRVTV